MRELIEAALAAGRYGEARSAAEAMWRAQPNGAVANYVLECAARWRETLPGRPWRVYFLRSFTVEPMVPLLRAGGALMGLELTVGVGPLGAYMQEVLEGESGLYRFRPDTVIVAVQTRDIAPQLWEDGVPGAGLAAVVAEVLGHFTALVERLRSDSPADLILHALEEPVHPSWGVLDGQRPDGQAAAVQEINQGLRRLVSRWPGVYLLGYDRLVANYGRLQWHDERKWLLVRLPMRAECQPVMVNEWLRYLVPLAGRGVKVVVTDLDNTLWGGVLGEDGPEGIQVGIEHPGAHYRALQQTLVDFARRGILLAVCSKNDEPEALAAMDSHPGMLLRSSAFAATRINWTDKSQNLREIAGELNVGLDALAFLDDSPVECERVRRELPEVTVIELPREPAAYAATVRRHPGFERLALSQEDEARGELYRVQKERVTAQRQFGTVEEFYESLRQEVVMALVDPAHEQRVAQLTQKTNQFNLTGRRYSEAEIHELARREGARVFEVSVRDRFGDNGIVGVIVFRYTAGVGVIETMLMSCRVIGRTVETAMMALLVRFGRQLSLQWIEGWFVPTAKNGPARDFYANHQFAQVEAGEAGTRWRLPVESCSLACPRWIRASLAKDGNDGESIAS
jgi:FkbH-like protein